jgi:hypothetical protein
MCTISATTPRAPSLLFLTHHCQAQLEPSDGTIRVRGRRVNIEVMRHRGRVSVEVWRADNGDVVYYSGDIAGLGFLSRHCSFSMSQVKAIRAKILAALPA